MLDTEKSHIADRLKKLEDLRTAGIEPYPYTFAKTHSSQDILSTYDSLKKEEHTKDIISVAGRIMTLRRMGKVTFFHIQDQSGKVQVYLRKDDVGADTYAIIKHSDIGDIVGVTGTVFRTKLGEVSIYAKNYTMLTKTVRPLPEKFHGLKDPELRYRKRYLDLLMNPDVKDAFIIRAKIISSFRKVLDAQGFLEVDTPTLQPIYGGANARPFKSHLNSLNMDVYLRISNELYLKRLIVGGFEKVYEFARDFRNEGIDRSHNPEFTQIELYQAWVDFHTMMEVTETLITTAIKEVHSSFTLPYGDLTLDFTPPFERLTMMDALKKYAELDVAPMKEKEVYALLKKYKLAIEGTPSRGIAIQLLFEELVEDKLLQPVFITEHPEETTPLCKKSRTTPGFVERFELFIAGMEFANAYSELNNPLKQRELLQQQAEDLRAGNDEAHPMDEDFIEAIEYGMPPTGGVGIGIDRLSMIIANKHSIRDVIFFPFMKPE